MKKLSVILALSLMISSLTPAGAFAAQPTAENAVEISAAAETSAEAEMPAAPEEETPSGTGKTADEEKAAGNEETASGKEETASGTGNDDAADALETEESAAGAQTGDPAAEMTEPESSPEAGTNAESSPEAASDAESSPEAGTDSESSPEEGKEASDETGTNQNPETAGIMPSSGTALSTEELVVEEAAAEPMKAAARSADKDADGNILHFYLYGVMVRNDWAKISIGGKKYSFYFDENGKPKTGWKTVGGGVRYFADYRYPGVPRGAMLTGFKTISGKRYYLGTDGIRQTGFKTVSGNRYYMADYRYPKAPKGAIQTGIRTIAGKAYFFNSRGIMQTGWVRTGGGLWGYYTDGGPAGKKGWRQKGSSWLYLKDNGQAKSGWLRLSSTNVFYLDGAQGGIMVSGPTRVGGKLYYFDGNGCRASTKGWKNYGGSYYYTYEDGTIAADTTVNGFEVDENGKANMTAMDLKAQNYYSSTSYLILVDKSNHQVGIYRQDGDAWLPLRKFSCGDGKPSTPTIEGSFTVGIKMLYFDSGSARCWYATQFSGNYLFHSVLYYQASGPYSVMDGRLGEGVSHGCVRLQIDNARWIYNNIPRGTKVVVYR